MDEREAHSWVWSAAEELLRREDKDLYHSTRFMASCGSVETKQCIQQNVQCLYGEGERVTTPATNSDINTLTPMP